MGRRGWGGWPWSGARTEQGQGRAGGVQALRGRADDVGGEGRVRLEGRGSSDVGGCNDQLSTHCRGRADRCEFLGEASWRGRQGPRKVLCHLGFVSPQSTRVITQVTLLCKHPPQKAKVKLQMRPEHNYNISDPSG